MKKPNGLKSSSDTQNDLMLKQSIGEIMGDESWQSNMDTPEESFPYGNSENIRKVESPQALKMLQASSDDSNRKQILGISSTQTRERRKVQLVEQPIQKMGGRNPQATRAAPVSQGRPMSADDIQKAKMRALFMQSKYGKSGSSNENKEARTEGPNKTPVNHSSTLNPASKAVVRSKNEEQKKPAILHSRISDRAEAPLEVTLKTDLRELPLDKCKRVQIPWKPPAEMKHSDTWSVGAGENSKEVEGQKNRNRREKETLYQTVEEIPPNPKEPWDIEMDYDDSLTPEIPIEQLPDADAGETQIASSEAANSFVSLAPSLPQVGNGSTAEPDLELLAVLLKNPELVFALTSGQAGNLSSADTVKLLDMIKAGGAGLAGAGVNMSGGRVEEKVEVSLPSPTPSSNPGTSGWRSEVAKDPFSQQSSMANRVAYAAAGSAATSMILSQVTPAALSPPQQPSSFPSMAQQVAVATMPTYSLPQMTTMVHSVHQSHPTNSTIQIPHSEVVLTTRNPSPMGNLSSAASPSTLRHDSTSNTKPAHVSVTMNAPARAPASFPSYPLSRSTTQPQTAYQSLHHQSNLLPEARIPATYYSRPPDPVSDSWRTSQGVPLNYPSQANQNNYNLLVGGSRQHMVQPGPSWERNEYVVEEEFESWSPENSPTRSSEYMLGRDLQEARTNPGFPHRPDRSRQRNFSGFGDHNRYGDRKWRERRH